MIRYDKPASKLIQIRRSWRNYREEPVSPDAKERIRTFISEVGDPPFGSTIRFAIEEAQLSGAKRPQGTYGVVKGASTFLVGILRPSNKGLEDFGYLFEAVVLFITSLGLGTSRKGNEEDQSDFITGLLSNQGCAFSSWEASLNNDASSPKRAIYLAPFGPHPKCLNDAQGDCLKQYLVASIHAFRCHDTLR